MFAQSLFFFSLLYVLSLILTVSSSDWFLIWLGLEMNMMSFIVLVYDRSSSGVEVCMKYFFIQSLGSGILMMMFYSKFYWVEMISLSVLSYKIGGGPFYFWFPAVCASMGWGGCFMLMTVQKILPLVLMSFLVSMMLWVIILISLFVGAVGSMNQKNMKRLMSYSSIHHIGWMLVGNYISEKMWIIYLAAYSTMLAGIIYSLHQDKILDVGGLGKVTHKWSFVLGMLSMGGMPPMLGFYLKWWLFYNLMFIDMSLLVLMVIMSVLMFYIYFRVVYMVIMESKSIKSWGMIMSKKSVVMMDLLMLVGMNTMMFVWVIM